MSSRVAPAITASFVVIIVAACGASAGASPSRAPSTTPQPIPVVTPEPTASQDAGNVDGDTTGPELTIVRVDAETIDVTLADPDAKAWRLVVRGVGERAADRWEIQVVTGDLRPDITATEIRAGRTMDVMDLSGFADGTAAAGGCHGTLPVCLSSNGFRLPRDGDGTFSARLLLSDAATLLMVTGGTASWPGEPFILGPWTDTEAFPWGAQR